MFLIMNFQGFLRDFQGFFIKDFDFYKGFSSVFYKVLSKKRILVFKLGFRWQIFKVMLSLSN